MNFLKGIIGTLLTLLIFPVDLWSQCGRSEISFFNGETEIYICPGDGLPNFVIYENTDSSGLNYSYIITDALDHIIDISKDSFYNFEDAGIGTCRIWGASHEGILIGVPGEDVTKVFSSTGGCVSLSNNVLRVLRDDPNSGSIELTTSSRDTFLCSGKVTDTIFFNSNNFSFTKYAYIISNGSTVIDVIEEPFYDFGTLEPSEYRVYGVSYNGSILIPFGQEVDQSSFSTECFDLSDNFINIEKASPEASLLVVSGQADSFLVCGMDEREDFLNLNIVSNQNLNEVIVVTDTSGIIVDIKDSSSVDLNTLALGTCYLHGLIYTGNLADILGKKLDYDGISTGCWDLTPNSILIKKVQPFISNITTENGDLIDYTCPDDNFPDRIRFIVDSFSDNPRGFLVVEESNLEISAILENRTFYDFEALPPGTSRVYGFSYTGSITIEKGDTLGIQDLSDDCFSITENYVTVVRRLPDAKRVSLENGDTTLSYCVQSTSAYNFVLKNEVNNTSPYAYVITNNSGNIKQIVQKDTLLINSNIPSDFDRIWGIAYTGDIIAQIGQNINFSTFSSGCFDVSENFVVIKPVTVRATNIFINGSNTSKYFCPIFNEPESVTISTFGFSSADKIFVLTDEENKIILSFRGQALSFDNMPEGEYRIWGVSYTNDINLPPGQKLDKITISSECFDLTDNYVTIIKAVPFSGQISTRSGLDNIYVCPVNDNMDIVKFNNSESSIFENYRFIITDLNDKITGFSSIDSIDFNLQSQGISRVYGLAYAGFFIANIGQDITIANLATKCFDLSPNFITINKLIPPNTDIVSDHGDSVVICQNDGISDSIQLFNNDTTGINYIYSLTGTDDVVQQMITKEESLSLEGRTPGMYRLYGVAYTGRLDLKVNDNILSTTISNDCFTISSNSISLTLRPDSVNCTVSANDLIVDNTMIRIFPNPTENIINVILDEHEASAINEFKIYNLTGQEVYFQKLAHSTHTAKLKLSQLNNGYYILAITLDDGRKGYKKIIKRN